MERFLDFPREIRDEIYAICLVSDYTIVPYADPCEDAENEKSDQAISAKEAILNHGLLGTSRMIRDESSSIFYGRNTFHCTLFMVGKEPNHREDLALMWGPNIKYFRRLSITFDFRQSCTWRRGSIASDLESLIEADGGVRWRELSMNADDEPFAGYLQRQSYLLERLWGKDLHLIRKMTLTHLVININHGYYPIRCCLLVTRLIINGILSLPWTGELRKGPPHAHYSDHQAYVQPLNVGMEAASRLHNTKVVLKGFKYFREFEACHNHGYMCLECPSKINGEHGPTGCGWRNKFSAEKQRREEIRLRLVR